MLWIRKRSIRHMITWCGISGLESSKLLLQLLRCDTGSPTALCRGVWLFLRELPDTVVSALWETSAVAPSGTANISRKCSLHAALSQQTLHLIPCVSSRGGYMSWHQRKGVRATKAGMMGDKVDYRWGNAIAPEWEVSLQNVNNGDLLFADCPRLIWRRWHVRGASGVETLHRILRGKLNYTKVLAQEKK